MRNGQDRLSPDTKQYQRLWLGRFVSSTGSALTGFAIGIWLFTETGSVTVFALSNFFVLMPAALLSPVAGALVDRCPRRLVILLTDSIQAAAALFVGVMFFTDQLVIWHVYAIVGLGSAAQAFQGPAWAAVIPALVAPEERGQAAGMGRLGGAASRLIAPALAGAMLLSVGLGFVILLDLATYLLAVILLVITPIPDSPRSERPRVLDTSVLDKVAEGWRYLTARPDLLTFVLLISSLSLFLHFSGDLAVPLGLTLANEADVGVMMSLVASGILLGSLITATWPGPRRRMRLLLGLVLLQGAALVAAGLRPSVPLLTVGLFVRSVCFALISGLVAPILRARVAPVLQDKVLTSMSFLALFLQPFGHLAVGPVADHWFEPLMAANGALAPVVGPLIGVGPGRGMALLFIMVGLLIIALGIYGLRNSHLRALEEDGMNGDDDLLARIRIGAVHSGQSLEHQYE